MQVLKHNANPDKGEQVWIVALADGVNCQVRRYREYGEPQRWECACSRDIPAEEAAELVAACGFGRQAIAEHTSKKDYGTYDIAFKTGGPSVMFDYFSGNAGPPRVEPFSVDPETGFFMRALSTSVTGYYRPPDAERAGLWKQRAVIAPIAVVRARTPPLGDLWTSGPADTGEKVGERKQPAQERPDRPADDV
jgi:hypothetical protein